MKTLVTLLSVLGLFLVPPRTCSCPCGCQAMVNGSVRCTPCATNCP